MAQKTGKEETEFKVPETLSLCVNNCGFTGNPATNNMCQKCFSATGGILKAPSRKAESPRSSSARPADRSGFVAPNDAPRPAEMSHDLGADGPDRAFLVDATARREVNRCSGCRRRVGLTGFRCRCGELFCAEHRYTDRHDCSYDYKSAGREAITRENPVVKAAKIVRV